MDSTLYSVCKRMEFLSLYTCGCGCVQGGILFSLYTWRTTCATCVKSMCLGRAPVVYEVPIVYFNLAQQVWSSFRCASVLASFNSCHHVRRLFNCIHHQPSTTGLSWPQPPPPIGQPFNWWHHCSPPPTRLSWPPRLCSAHRCATFCSLQCWPTPTTSGRTRCSLACPPWPAQSYQIRHHSESPHRVLLGMPKLDHPIRSTTTSTLRA